MPENTGPLPSARDLERHPVTKILRDARSGARVTPDEIKALELGDPATQKLTDAVVRLAELRESVQVEVDSEGLAAEVPGLLGNSFQPLDEAEDAPPKRVGTATVCAYGDVDAAYPGLLEGVFSALSPDQRSPDYFTPEDSTPDDPRGLSERVGGHCF